MWAGGRILYDNVVVVDDDDDDHDDNDDGDVFEDEDDDEDYNVADNDVEDDDVEDGDVENDDVEEGENDDVEEEDRSQDRDPHFARACAMEMHGNFESCRTMILADSAGRQNLFLAGWLAGRLRTPGLIPQRSAAG